MAHYRHDSYGFYFYLDQWMLRSVLNRHIEMGLVFSCTTFDTNSIHVCIHKVSTHVCSFFVLVCFWMFGIIVNRVNLRLFLDAIGGCLEHISVYFYHLIMHL